MVDSPEKKVASIDRGDPSYDVHIKVMAVYISTGDERALPPPSFVSILWEFFRTLRNVKPCMESQKECDMDVVTMAGDEFNRKGGISGGYHDDRSARLLTLERIRELGRDLKDLSKQQKDMQAKVCRRSFRFFVWYLFAMCVVMDDDGLFCNDYLMRYVPSI